MTEAAKAAIESGDAASLAALLKAEAALADRPIPWFLNQRNESPPLQYLCHVSGEGRISADAAVALADVLIAAGADVNNRRGPHGDSMLIAAASLWAPEVGLRLLAAGADPHVRGLFGATALHWASRLGLPELVKALIEAGSDVDLKDASYGSSPLGWAAHSRWTKAHPERGDPLACVRLLVAAAAKVEPRWLALEPVQADRDLYETLGARSGG
jgi:hypothetical protein